MPFIAISILLMIFLFTIWLKVGLNIQKIQSRWMSTVSIWFVIPILKKNILRRLKHIISCIRQNDYLEAGGSVTIEIICTANRKLLICIRLFSTCYRSIKDSINSFNESIYVSRAINNLWVSASAFSVEWFHL